MRAVVQRVNKANVRVGREMIGEIGTGLVVFLGVGREDRPEDCRYLAGKVANLRIFEDVQGRMNRSVKDIAGAVLSISQFTLYGDCRKGRRPSFIDAASPEEAERLYELFNTSLREQGIPVVTGRFQAMMHIAVENYGPVTILLDSKKGF